MHRVQVGDLVHDSDGVLIGPILQIHCIGKKRSATIDGTFGSFHMHSVVKATRRIVMNNNVICYDKKEEQWFSFLNRKAHVIIVQSDTLSDGVSYKYTD